jgi:hypothetical protein
MLLKNKEYFSPKLMKLFSEFTLTRERVDKIFTTNNLYLDDDSDQNNDEVLEIDSDNVLNLKLE